MHLRKGGGEPAAVDSRCGTQPEPKVEPRAEPEAKPEVKEVIYAIGLKGID